MKRQCLAISLCIVLTAVPLWANMSKTKAILEAHKIWGPFSHVQQGLSWGDGNDTFDIGFNSKGCAVDFTIMGTGVNSWDAAFAALPPGKGISPTPITGMMTFNLSTAELVTEPATATVVPGAYAATSVQFLLDGQPYGSRVPITVDNTTTPPTISAPSVIDTTMTPDGMHVICAQLFHVDLAQANTHAEILIFKQVAPTNPVARLWSILKKLAA